MQKIKKMMPTIILIALMLGAVWYLNKTGYERVVVCDPIITGCERGNR